MGIILDGKKTAEGIKKQLLADVAKLKRRKIAPTLAFFVTPGSVGETYVRIKERVAKELGINTLHGNLNDPTTEKIIKIINGWNKDKRVHGIVVQLPLPKKADTFVVLDSIDPAKDVDGLTAHSQNQLYRGIASSLSGKGQTLFVPATPLGVVELLKRYRIPIAGKHAVVVGRSLLVGKPLAMLLLKENSTVTVAHSGTKNLGEVTKQADILVSAVGRPKLIKDRMVKKGAIVVDVGITHVSGKLVGDVDFNKVKKIASYITPVPGGVGPMTVAMLMRNVVKVASNSK